MVLSRNQSPFTSWLLWPSLLLFLAQFSVLTCATAVFAETAPQVFHTSEEAQPTMEFLPQWLNALERHVVEDAPEGQCSEGLFNKCHLNNWLAFLSSIKGKPRAQQLEAVNRYANQKLYVIDLANYGKEDYWAIAKEFLYNGGDCEDYAISKFFSLRWLGYDADALRLLILQDTNLRVQHAVLIVFEKGQVLVLDNQSQQVLPQEKILHYVPLYSVNEKQWWLHVPPAR